MSGKKDKYHVNMAGVSSLSRGVKENRPSVGVGGETGPGLGMVSKSRHVHGVGGRPDRAPRGKRRLGRRR